MKRSVSSSIFLSLILASANWAIASNGKSTAMVAVTPSTDTCVRVGRLISVEGKVQIKRQIWSEYHPTAVGAVLCFGDLLQPAKGAKVIVQCADPNQMWTVPQGMVSGATIGCSPPDEPIHTITGPITPTRSLFIRSIPYIISPNSTLLLNHKPIIHWQAVPGATNYTVRVSGLGVNWETQVSTNSVVYPGEPPLKPVEQGYLLTVEADNGESAAKATFGLLNQNKAQQVRLAAEQIARQNLTEEAKTLALVDLYIGQELIAEAIEQLEILVAKDSKTAAIYCILGDLYAQVKLLYTAEKSYLKAFELARVASDMEGQAKAAARLAAVYKVLGNSNKANRWHTVAQERYLALGEQPN